MDNPLLRLPPLDPLRGFVATAQALSFTRAAKALCLTQSAISRQIQTLEEGLGVSLFVRGTRSLSLTPEGERLYRQATVWLRDYAEFAASVRAAGLRPPVTVTASIGISALWLLPRLGTFLQARPGLDVRISATNAMSDLRRDGLDLAIRYCPPEAAPPGAIRLFGETIAPVAHPSLGLSVLDSPELLAGQVLLEFDGDYRPWFQWSEWLAARGWQQAKPRGVLRFNQYDQLIQAAIAGQGLALGRLELISAMLADGRLTRLGSAQPGPPSPNAYWLILNDPEPRAEVAEVVRWISEEAGALGF